MSWFREQQSKGKGNRKITDDQVKQIRNMVSDGMSVSQISKALGLARSTVGNVRSGARLYTEGVD